MSHAWFCAAPHCCIRKRFALIGAVLLSMTLAPQSPAHAQQADDELWVTNGQVHATRFPETLSTSAATSRASAPGRQLRADRRLDGQTVACWPKINGSVSAIRLRWRGRLVCGRALHASGGHPRSNIAHIRADLSVGSWNPGSDGWVRALAMRGSTVYVGGWFTQIGGQSRNYLAALDAGTGMASG